MDTVKVCESCGKPLPPDAPQGVCPECLLKAGFPTGTQPDPEGKAAPRSRSFEPPTVAELAAHFTQLEIIELVGRGGMGAVYRARQKELDRFVALKILPPGIGDDPSFAERFAREARALAKLNHPNIVTLYEFGQACGTSAESPRPSPPDPRSTLYYFLMEFVDGVNLRQLLDAGRVSSREALAIVPQICDALQFAHDHGIVHRDIKPENILLDRLGRVKVADFGLAKLVGDVAQTSTSSGSGDFPVASSDAGDTGQESPVNRQAGKPAPHPDLTDAGKVMGTPQYMAPEQVKRPLEVDHRVDIYAIGVVFYQMLTGELPGKRIEPPSRKVQIDVRLDEVVLRALEANPERRYSQASAMKTAVETIVSGQQPGPGSEPVEGGSERTEQHQQAPPIIASKRKPWVAFCAAIAFAGTAGFGVLCQVMQARVPGGLLIGVFLLLCFLGPGLAVLLNRFADAKVQQQVFRISAGLALLTSLPLIGFAGFFIFALAQESGGWNPAPAEAVLVPLTWLGALVLPVCGLRLWRASRNLPIRPSGSPRHSRTAIAGAVWAGIFFVAALLTISAGSVAEYPPDFLTLIIKGWWVLLLRISVLSLGLTAPIGTTILGIIALRQIRHSDGRLHGPGLALFDALLFPLLALNGLIIWLGNVAGDWLAPQFTSVLGRDGFTAVMVTLIALACGGVTLPIVLTAWRRARVYPGSPFPVSKTSGSISRMIWRGAVAALVIMLLAGAALVWMQRPQRLDTPISSDSPDGMYSGTASTWRAMRVFGSDQFTYRFVVQGRGGEVFEKWEARVPTERLATNYGAMAVDDFLFNPHGSIRWEEDGSVVSFRVNDIEVHRQRVAKSEPKEVAAAAVAPAVANDESFPKGAHIGRNDRSVFLVHDDKSLHYALYYAGDFNSSSRSSNNPRTGTWTDDGSLVLPNGRTFGYLRDSSDPDHLRINGREFDLGSGRLFMLLDDGSTEQLEEFPSLVDARELDEIARVVAANSSFEGAEDTVEIVSAPSAKTGLEFRLVADPAERNVPVELLPMAAESNRPPLRVMRTALLGGDALQSATLQTNPINGASQIEVQFTDDGAKGFAEITRTNVGRQLAMVFEGAVLSSPVIQTEISGGRAVISGSFSAAECAELVRRLNRSAGLPERPDEASHETELEAAQAQLESLLTRFTEEHPLVLRLRKSIEEMEKAATRDLIARYEAARTIGSFTERDDAMTAVAAVAARAGDWAIAKKALEQMTAFTRKDAASAEAARLLSRRGLTAEAIELAGGITSFSEKDAAMGDLAVAAARSGDWAATKKALKNMTAFTARDEAAGRAAVSLAKAGYRAEAVDIAGSITSFSKRDQVLKELAR